MYTVSVNTDEAEINMQERSAVALTRYSHKVLSEYTGVEINSFVSHKLLLANDQFVFYIVETLKIVKFILKRLIKIKPTTLERTPLYGLNSKTKI